MNDPLNPELEPGLYIVATPIGNLGDITRRAVTVLAQADLIAVEDSRVTGKLLHHLGISARMRPYHDHSNDAVRETLIAAARVGVVALVSDAGTPLISDPGYRLVRAARMAGVMVTTVPGPNAAIAALTLSGLPTDRFLFAGFLPAKPAARNRALAGLGPIDATLICYESGPRLAAMLTAAATVLTGREVVVVREITKHFEEVVTGTASNLAARYAGAPPKGEIVVLFGPPDAPVAPQAAALDAALIDALGRLSAAKAAGEVARATGADRKALYVRALELKAAK